MNIEQIMPYLPSSCWVAWRDFHSVYQGCNAVFSSWARVSSKGIHGLKLGDLKSSNLKPVDPDCCKEISEIDQKVFDTVECLEKAHSIYFQNDYIYYPIVSKTIPIIDNGGKICGLFSMGTFDNGPSLNMQTIFRLVNKRQIAKLLIAKKYFIKWNSISVCLSRREMTCLLYLLKGKTAREAAMEMNISVRTAEDLIALLKEKADCKNKSELISLTYESNWIEVLREYHVNSAELSLKNLSNNGYLYNNDKRIFLKFE